MAIYNVHSRVLHRTGADQAWALVDTLATTNDALWPAADWPAMRLDAPLSVGAAGGHGPIRYTVIGYAPGHWVRFRFTGPRGFDGFHEFTVHDGPDGAELRHTLAITARGPARFTWPLAYRWMHDAALEDCLDRAELATTGGVQHPARWSPNVRLLRRLVGRAPKHAPTLYGSAPTPDIDHAGTTAASR